MNQDQGTADAVVEAKFGGDAAHRRLQPAVPGRRGRGGVGRRGGARDARRAEARRRPAGRPRGLPVPAHARAGALTRAASVGSSSLTSATTRPAASSSGPASPRCSAPTARARPTWSRPWPTWPRWRASAACRVRPWCATGAIAAVVRAEVEQADGRVVSIECELHAGRAATACWSTASAWAGPRTCSAWCGPRVFSPDDLALVKGGPAVRRRFLDQTVVGLHPRLRRGRARPGADPAPARPRCSSRPAAGSARRPRSRSTSGTRSWPRSGRRSGRGRAELVADAGDPRSAEAYDDLAGRPARGHGRVRAGLARRPAWPSALAAARAEDVRRQVCLVGPHRDDLDLDLNGLPARTHASQGEQRTLALALRLAAHRLVTERVGSAPVLLLDDVFSELDPRPEPRRCSRHLPAGPGRPHHRRPAARRAPAPSGCCGSRAGGCWHERRRSVRRAEGAARQRRRRRAVAARDRAPGAWPASSPGGRRPSGRRSRPTPSPLRWSTAACVVDVDHPTWATQLRFLEADLLQRLRDVAGVDEVRPDRAPRPASLRPGTAVGGGSSSASVTHPLGRL